MTRLERAGVITAYAVEGAGPPVLLIHGVGARLDAWDGVVTALGGRFTTIRLDLRGHGESSKPPGPYSAALFAEDARALLDHLGIGRCHVAGHSLGATVALRLALDAPDRVERLALLSAAAGRTEEERQRVMERLAIVERGIPGEHFRRSLPRWFSDEFRRANAALLERYAARNMENDPRAYAAAYRVLATTDLADEAARIRVPTLVVTGEGDIGSNPRMARLLHARIPGSRLEILPGPARHPDQAPTTVARLPPRSSSARRPAPTRVDVAARPVGGSGQAPPSSNFGVRP
jgi:pimeloyl-ACP methyl ester carboxylesterase